MTKSPPTIFKDNKPTTTMMVIYYLQKNINVKFPRITTEIGRNIIFPRRDKLGPEGKRGKGDRPQRQK